VLTESGEFDGFRFGASTEIVPAVKSWVVVNESEYGNLRGISILDAVYEPWYWWTANVLFLNRYMERRGTPHIKARAPKRIIDKDGIRSSATEIMSSIVENLYDGGVATLPAEFDPQTRQALWDIEYLRDDARAEMFISWLEHLEILMLLGLFIPDSVLMTPRREGSRALAEVRERIYSTIGSLDVASLERHFNRFVVPQLQELNFGQNQPKAMLKAQIRPTDRQSILLDLVSALIRARDSEGASRILAMTAVREILQQLGIPTAPLLEEEEPEIPTVGEPEVPTVG
jgi:hypothetical protein